MSNSRIFSCILLSVSIGVQTLVCAQLQDTLTDNQTATNYLKDSTMNKVHKFELKPLPFSSEALEPFIDKLTIEIHYGKHHKAYYDNFLNAIKGTEMESMEIKDIFKNISKYPVAVRNNSGGYYNHTFYWDNMRPAGGPLPEGDFAEAVARNYGSLESLKKQFSDAAKSRFGSGWAWLCLDDKGNMFIISTPNQDNPLMDISEKKGYPLLTLDVWEHAYYLKYQNKRPDYIDAFWNLINWKAVAERYDEAFLKLKNK